MYTILMEYLRCKCWHYGRTFVMFFFSSRRRHTRCGRDWSSDVCFFFQAEDGIRDADVTGVQTCALPIYWRTRSRWFNANAFANPGVGQYGNAPRTIDSARYQFRKNIDFVLSKEVRFASSQRSEERRVGKGWKPGGAAEGGRGKLCERGVE